MLDAKAVLTSLVFILSFIVKGGGQRCKFGKEALDTFLALNAEWKDSQTPFVDGAIGNVTYDSCKSGLTPLVTSQMNPWSYDCPFNYTKTDRGFRFYPRWEIEARCLCRLCIRKNAKNCVKIRAKMKILYIEGCTDDGIAAYKIITETVTTGCQCEDSLPRPPSGGGPASQ